MRDDDMTEFHDLGRDDPRPRDLIQGLREGRYALANPTHMRQDRAPVAGDAVSALPDRWRALPWPMYVSLYDVARQLANELESALAQDRASQAGASGVPEGWRLVPVEPTRKMLDAYVSVSQPFHSARDDWAAMLAAAPTPAAEGEVRRG